MSKNATPHSDPQTGMVESILLQLPLRVALGGVFVLAAYNKIPAIQSFAEAIKGFRIVDADAHPELIVMAAFVIPWFELIAGLLLIVGLRARAAALGIGLLLLIFTLALVRVIYTDIDADCSCFGDQNLFCSSTVGWCQVIRDVIMLIPAVYLLWRGPGRVSLDQKLARSGPGPDQSPPGAQNPSQSIQYDVDDDALRA